MMYLFHNARIYPNVFNMRAIYIRENSLSQKGKKKPTKTDVYNKHTVSVNMFRQKTYAHSKDF